jgi:hypothetical protein
MTASTPPLQQNGRLFHPSHRIASHLLIDLSADSSRHPMIPQLSSVGKSIIASISSSSDEE